jgi:hypothetical protein
MNESNEKKEGAFKKVAEDVIKEARRTSPSISTEPPPTPEPKRKPKEK